MSYFAQRDRDVQLLAGHDKPTPSGIPGPVLQLRLEDLSHHLASTSPRAGPPRKPLNAVSDSLKADIVACLEGIASATTALLHQKRDPQEEGAEASLAQRKERLQSSLCEFQVYLSVYLMDATPSTPRSGTTTPRGYIPPADRDPYRVALYMTALLDLAKEVTDLTDTVEQLVAGADEQPKWRFPNVFWFWRGKGTIGSGHKDKDKNGEAGKPPQRATHSVYS